jgi:histidyl-tRNA synthetase
VVSRGEAGEAAALPLARRCRAAGLAVELDASGAAFGKQFKRADRSGARFAAVIGDAEADAGEVVLKDLRGERPEQRLASSELAGVLAGVMTPQHLSTDEGAGRVAGC